MPSDWKRVRRRVLKRDHELCYLCGAPASEVDHVTPGDDHDEANLAAICTSCHLRKSGAERYRRRTP